MFIRWAERYPSFWSCLAVGEKHHRPRRPARLAKEFGLETEGNRSDCYLKLDDCVVRDQSPSPTHLPLCKEDDLTWFGRMGRRPHGLSSEHRVSPSLPDLWH